MRMTDREHSEGGPCPRHVGSPQAAEPMTLPYEAPRLVVLGDLRSLTLGGPSGIGDSSVPLTQQP